MTTLTSDTANTPGTAEGDPVEAAYALWQKAKAVWLADSAKAQASSRDELAAYNAWVNEKNFAAAESGDHQGGKTL